MSPLPDTVRPLKRCPECACVLIPDEPPGSPVALAELLPEVPPQELHRERLYRGRKKLSLRKRLLAVLCWGWVLGMSALTLSTLGDDFRPAISAYEERGELNVDDVMLSDGIATLIVASFFILPAVLVGLNVRRLGS